MKILVTGATGDVGREVTARLLEDGLAVRALCRAAPDGLPLGVEVASGTLESPAQLAAATRGVDAVVHCAAHLGNGGRTVHRHVNVTGTRAVLAAAQDAGVRRVVHLSSVAVYGRKDDGQTVSPADGYDPCPALRCDYAWSKIAAERWVDLYRAEGVLDPVVLRPGIVYGGRRNFLARVARRGPRGLLLVLGSPTMLLPLVHVRDVAEAVVRTLRLARAPAAPLDLVGPRPPTQAEWLARHCATGDERLVPLYLPVARMLRALTALPAAASALAYRLAWATQSVRYDDAAVTRALGWRPGIHIDQGLAPRAEARVARGVVTPEGGVVLS